jgi:hypothetical protein
MSDDAFPTALCLVALFLGSMQGRVATLLSRARSGGVAFFLLEDRSLGAYTPLPILIGWLAVLAWAFKAWSWYWPPASVVVFALASGPLVNLRMLPVWTLLRVACAVVIIGAAAILWVEY